MNELTVKSFGGIHVDAPFQPGFEYWFKYLLQQTGTGLPTGRF